MCELRTKKALRALVWVLRAGLGSQSFGLGSQSFGLGSQNFALGSQSFGSLQCQTSERSALALSEFSGGLCGGGGLRIGEREPAYKLTDLFLRSGAKRPVGSLMLWISKPPKFDYMSSDAQIKHYIMRRK